MALTTMKVNTVNGQKVIVLAPGDAITVQKNGITDAALTYTNDTAGAMSVTVNVKGQG